MADATQNLYALDFTTDISNFTNTVAQCFSDMSNQIQGAAQSMSHIVSSMNATNSETNTDIENRIKNQVEEQEYLNTQEKLLNEERFKNNEIGYKELTNRSQELEDKITAIKKQGILDRIALNPKDSPEQKKAKQELAQSDLDKKKKEREQRLSPFKPIITDMTSAMDKAFLGLLKRTMTMKQALTSIWKSLWQSILKSFIQEFVLKKTAAVVKGFMEEKAMAFANYITQTEFYKMITGAKVESVVQGTTANTNSVSADVIASETKGTAALSEAASKGAGSVAGTPWIGPALAIAAFAAIMALMGKKGGGGKTLNSAMSSVTVPSASGGFDIPAGINPLTQLHEKEMVLPAEHAQTIRNLSGKKSEMKETLHLHVNAMDSRDVKRFLIENRGAVADALKGALRDFKR